MPGPGDSSFRGALEELSFAYGHVPFYREHLDRAGIRPEQVTSPADLLAVPATSKSDYRRNFPARVLAAGRRLSEPGVFTVSTSGTTDERLITVHRAALASRRLFGTWRIHRGLWEVLCAEPVRRYAWYAPPQCTSVDCANPDATMAARRMPNGRLALPTTADFLLTPPRLLDQAAHELDDFRPVVVDGDPFRIGHLARHVVRYGQAPLQAGAFAFGFCQTTPWDRRAVQEAARPGAPVVEMVGMSEFGKIASECEHGRMHINGASFHAELIVGGRVAAPGELAELYVTTIGDRLAPHVRYRTGDLYRPLAGGCPCGSDYPAVRFEGRTSSVMTLTDGRLVTPRAVADALAALPLRLYQLEQREPARFCFAYIPAAGGPDLATPAIREALRGILGPHGSIEIAARDYLASAPSGKFLTCRSALGVPAAFA